MIKFALFLFFFTLHLVDAMPKFGDLPQNIIGISTYNYFTQHLPEESKGVYIISKPCGKVKYIGSSIDINKRLSSHHKNKILEKDDSVYAYIFRYQTRQEEILNFERRLIKHFNPPYNIHPGAPGRPALGDLLSKLEHFLEHNKDIMTKKGYDEITSFVRAKKPESLAHSQRNGQRGFSISDLKTGRMFLKLMKYIK